VHYPPFFLRLSTTIIFSFTLQRDEDFDGSFEGLTNLTAALGEVKQRNTPGHIIAGLPSGKYSEWAAPGCDQRCPVCLDDVSVDSGLRRYTLLTDEDLSIRLMTSC
jgi:hypothetical protein